MSSPTMQEHWRDLVTTALLGTDRRDPPVAPAAIAALVDDTARSSPSERMLAQVAAATAVRRAGVLPGPALDGLAIPDDDGRRPCVPAAVERWHHIVESWPVLEDEWMVTLMTNEWRIAPELLPAMLLRHRADPVRRTRVMVGAGATGRWLVSHIDDLAERHPKATVDREALAELPELPIAPELAQMLDWPGVESGAVLGSWIQDATLNQTHKSMLVNLVARVDPGALADLAAALDRVDPMAVGHSLAATLGDLALTRHRMLAELVGSSPQATDDSAQSASS